MTSARELIELPLVRPESRETVEDAGSSRGQCQGDCRKGKPCPNQNPEPCNGGEIQ